MSEQEKKPAAVSTAAPATDEVRKAEEDLKKAKAELDTRLEVTGYDEIGQLAMALNNMAQSLSTLEVTRRSFVANVSHELRTPMTSIEIFRLVATEFSGMEDNTVSQWLELTSPLISRRVFGKLYD